MEELHLYGLGLNDSHCLAIAEDFRASGSKVLGLSLRFNPAISDEGYGALLGLMNWVNVIFAFRVDDKTWEAKLNLVAEMNRDHGRLEYMTDGTYKSERRRCTRLV
jgi:hypothetical protein